MNVRWLYCPDATRMKRVNFLDQVRLVQVNLTRKKTEWAELFDGKDLIGNECGLWKDET